MLIVSPHEIYCRVTWVGCFSGPWGPSWHGLFTAVQAVAYPTETKKKLSSFTIIPWKMDLEKWVGDFACFPLFWFCYKVFQKSACGEMVASLGNARVN